MPVKISIRPCAPVATRLKTEREVLAIVNGGTVAGAEKKYTGKTWVYAIFIIQNRSIQCDEIPSSKARSKFDAHGTENWWRGPGEKKLGPVVGGIILKTKRNNRVPANSKREAVFGDVAIPRPTAICRVANDDDGVEVRIGKSRSGAEKYNTGQ